MSRRLLCLTTALVLLWGAPVANAQERSTQAECGSVAVGGAAVGSTVRITNVVCGIPPEQLEALIRDKTRDQGRIISLLEEKLDLNQRQVTAALEILGEKDIPPERLAAKLVEIAERFKALQATAAAQPGDDPQVAALKAEAQTAIRSGEIQRAHDLLTRASEIETAALNTRAVRAAETHATLGQLELARLRYREAAKQFARAASRVPSENEEKREYLRREAGALYQQGLEFGDNDAAQSAIERYRHIVAITQRERVPLEWAETQNDLGRALWTLGERESGTARLEEAVAAFRAGLEERTRERFPG